MWRGPGATFRSAQNYETPHIRHGLRPMTPSPQGEGLRHAVSAYESRAGGACRRPYKPKRGCLPPLIRHGRKPAWLPLHRGASATLFLRMKFERAGHAAAPTVPRREIPGKSEITPPQSALTGRLLPLHRGASAPPGDFFFPQQKNPAGDKPPPGNFFVLLAS